MFVEIDKRMLYELAKLTSEVKLLNAQMREMRAVMEGVISGAVTVNNISIPELDHGPVKTRDDLKTFLNAAKKRMSSHFWFVHSCVTVSEIQ